MEKKFLSPPLSPPLQQYALPPGLSQDSLPSPGYHAAVLCYKSWICKGKQGRRHLAALQITHRDLAAAFVR
ncbi:hypothetical protein FKM82_030192 [Ascaphus truei]